jgi:transcription initiation factor TFIIH subunit 3
MLYSSTTPVAEEYIEPADANTYRPFKVLDSMVMTSIAREIEALGEPETEGMFLLQGVVMGVYPQI